VYVRLVTLAVFQLYLDWYSTIVLLSLCRFRGNT